MQYTFHQYFLIFENHFHKYIHQIYLDKYSFLNMFHIGGI